MDDAVDAIKRVTALFRPNMCRLSLLEQASDADHSSLAPAPPVPRAQLTPPVEQSTPQPNVRVRKAL